VKGRDKQVSPKKTIQLAGLLEKAVEIELENLDFSFKKLTISFVPLKPKAEVKRREDR